MSTITATGVSNIERVKADLARRASSAGGRQDGAKRKLAHNRAAAKRAWRGEYR